MVLHIKKSQSAMLLITEDMCLQFLSELFVAEVVVSHVERQLVPRMWSGGGKAPVAITAVCVWNRARPDVGQQRRMTTTILATGSICTPTAPLSYRLKTVSQA